VEAKGKSLALLQHGAAFAQGVELSASDGVALQTS
jgi:hypothetical protein